MNTRNVGDLQVWWVPQVPMKAFEVDVASVEEGVKILSVLAQYDIFKFYHHIKPAFANVGGLRRWCFDAGEGEPGWEDWYDEETWEDDPKLFLKKLRNQKA